MDATRRAAERALLRGDDPAARAAVIAHDLRTGAVTQRAVEVSAMLGDVAASHALGGRFFGDWSSGIPAVAEQLGQALTREECVRASLGVLRYTLGHWTEAHRPGTPRWREVHLLEFEITEERTHDSLATGEWVVRARVTPRAIEGWREAQEPVSIGYEVMFDGYEDGGDARARAELFRAIHRGARLPDVGGINRCATAVQMAVTYFLEGSTLRIPWAMDAEVRALGAGRRFAWLTALVRLTDVPLAVPVDVADPAAEVRRSGAYDLTRRETRLSNGTVVTDEQIAGDGWTRRGWWLREQLLSAAIFVQDGPRQLCGFLRAHLLSPSLGELTLGQRA